MPQYIRAKRKGGTFFFTVVTQQRRKLLLRAQVLHALRESFAEVQARDPFTLNAWVILPDHLHCIWTLREGDSEFSYKWSLIKAGVTRRLLADDAFIPEASVSRTRRREGPVWQRRFWEHRIRDEDDLYAHLDYIHYNPVKHGLENTVRKWRFSSFHSFVERGVYSPDWGLGEEQDMDAGE
jgi:putative transposase